MKDKTPKLIWKEIDKPNDPIFIKETETVVETFLPKKMPNPHDFLGEFRKLSKEEITAFLYIVLQLKRRKYSQLNL